MDAWDRVRCHTTAVSGERYTEAGTVVNCKDTAGVDVGTEDIDMVGGDGLSNTAEDGTAEDAHILVTGLCAVQTDIVAYRTAG